MFENDDLVNSLPNLRAFAISLCGNPNQAEDLVQDTAEKALDNRQSFVDGTNFKAWLFTILRNSYFSLHRKRRREVQDVDGSMAGSLVAPDNPESTLAFKELEVALSVLPVEQRESLTLVCIEGLDYELAASILGCAVGTIKSRVSRGRTRIAELLGETPPPTAIDEAWERLQSQQSSEIDDMPDSFGEDFE